MLPFPSPGDLPDPQTEPLSPALAGGFFTTRAPRGSQELPHQGQVELGPNSGFAGHKPQKAQ